jgi:L-threonylcarbamoyladenylate synthase
MAYKTDNFDDEIVRRLMKGDVGLLPTDTIYGISGRALDKITVNRIRQIKGRSHDKPFIILISDIKMLDLLSISADQARTAQHYWPGPLSGIFQAPSAPDWLRAADGTLAVRLPDYDKLVKLIQKTGPIISTSANNAGERPAQTAAQAESVFGGQLDFYVNIGPLNNPPSTLAAVKDGRLKVLRPGSVNVSKEDTI